MTKHLDSLKIQNFRMLEDFEVEKLGQVNLIVGKNNSGKSTVLEALRIYAGNANQKLLIELALTRGEKYKLEDNDDLQERPFEGFFTGRALSETKIIKIGTPNSSLELQLGFMQEQIIEKRQDGQILPTRQVLTALNRGDLLDSDYDEIIVILRNGELIDRLRDIRRTGVYGNREHLKFLSCSFVPTRSIQMSELAEDWDKIVFSEHEDTVKAALKIIDPDFLDITFVQDKYRIANRDSRTAIVKLLNHPKPVSLSSLGDGMTRILQIVLKVFAAKDGFLLIDEFENGLHYSVQEKVWGLIFEMAKRLNIQVFATTHSWDCIEAFSEVASQREDVEGLLFSMGRSAKTSDNGKIIATIFDEAKLQRFTQADMDVR